MRNLQFVVAFVLLLSISGQVNADQDPSNLDYYGYFHHYTVFPNDDDYCFYNAVYTFDVIDQITSAVNYLFINGNLSLFDDIDEKYTVENLGKKFVDSLKKQIVVQLPEIMGNFSGTGTAIIMDECKNDNGSIKRFNELTKTIQDNQIQRFALLWTGWEPCDDDNSKITVLGVSIPKPSLTPESEFTENENYKGLGVAVADFYEHIAFLEFRDEPYNIFPTPVIFEDNDCRDWLYHLVNGAKLAADYFPNEMGFLNFIPKRVNFNTEMLILKTYNNGYEVDLIPNNIDVLQTDPYFGLVLRICQDETFRDFVNEGLYEHDFCGSRLNLTQEHNGYHQYWNSQYGPRPPNNKGWSTNEWLVNHSRDPNDAFMNQKFIFDFLKVLDISYKIFETYGNPASYFGIYAEAVGDLVKEDGAFYRPGPNGEFLPNLLPNAHMDYVNWFYDYATNNDRFKSLEYYKAGPVRQNLYDTNFVIRELLNRMAHYIEYFPLDNPCFPLNEFFMLGASNLDGYCEPPGQTVEEGTQIDLEKLEWKMINTSPDYEHNEIRWHISPDDLKCMFIDVIIDDEKQFTLWECILEDFYYHLTAQDEKYLFNSFINFLDHFCWLITKSNPPDDFKSLKIGDPFPISMGNEEFHLISRYLYYFVCQYRYIDCDECSSESIDFWSNNYPIEPNFDAFGVTDLPAEDYLNPISAKMQEIADTKLKIQARWRYVACDNKLELGFHSENSLKPMLAKAYARFFLVKNGRNFNPANDIYVEIDNTLPHEDSIQVGPDDQLFWDLYDLQPLDPADIYQFRVALRKTGQPQYLVATDSKMIIIKQAGGISPAIMVNDCVAKEAKPMKTFDMNGDGFIDIVGVFDGQAVVLLNDGEGEFYNIGRYIGENVKKVSVGDLNRDGIPDIAIATSTSIETYIASADLDYEFSDIIYSCNEFNDAKIVDINADGFNHLFYSSELTAFEFFDVDMDGDLDIVVSSSDGTYLYLNDGLGNFEISEHDFGTGNATVIAFCDFNRDSYPDIFIGRPNSMSSVYINDGNGQFVPSSSVFPSNEIRAVCIEDFNHDGWQDIIIVSGETEVDSIWVNDQMGGFYNSGDRLIDGKMTAVLSADVDNDGEIEFIIGQQDKLVIQ